MTLFVVFAGETLEGVSVPVVSMVSPHRPIHVGITYPE